MKLGFTITFIGTCLLFSVSCDPFEWKYEEIRRLTSPDNMVDAVWVFGNGGATTGGSWSLYIVPKGLKFDKAAASFSQSIFKGDHFSELEFKWKQAKLLEIHFKKARIHQFRNFWPYWDPKEPEVDRKYVVEVKLIPGSDDSSLSDEDRRIK